MDKEYYRDLARVRLKSAEDLLKDAREGFHLYGKNEAGGLKILPACQAPTEKTAGVLIFHVIVRMRLARHAPVLLDFSKLSRTA